MRHAAMFDADGCFAIDAAIDAAYFPPASTPDYDFLCLFFFFLDVAAAAAAATTLPRLFALRAFFFSLLSLRLPPHGSHRLIFLRPPLTSSPAFRLLLLASPSPHPPLFWRRLILLLRLRCRLQACRSACFCAAPRASRVIDDIYAYDAIMRAMPLVYVRFAAAR